jgi:hypothetical protein
MIIKTGSLIFHLSSQSALHAQIISSLLAWTLSYVRMLLHRPTFCNKTFESKYMNSILPKCMERKRMEILAISNRLKGVSLAKA